jgi:hypothetical protein
VREVPDVPHPLHDHVPPEDGSGAKTTCAPEFTVALAVCVPLITAVIVVAGHDGALVTVMLWTCVDFVPQLLV